MRPVSGGAGLPSRDLEMPRRNSSSSIMAGLPSLLFLPLGPKLRFKPPGLLTLGLLLLLLGLDFFGVLGSRFKQLSKHSAQVGLPRRSTIGACPMFL